MMAAKGQARSQTIGYFLRESQGQEDSSQVGGPKLMSEHKPGCDRAENCIPATWGRKKPLGLSLHCLLCTWKGCGQEPRWGWSGPSTPIRALRTPTVKIFLLWEQSLNVWLQTPGITKIPHDSVLALINCLLSVKLSQLILFIYTDTQITGFGLWSNLPSANFCMSH